MLKSRKLEYFDNLVPEVSYLFHVGLVVNPVPISKALGTRLTIRKYTWKIFAEILHSKYFRLQCNLIYLKKEKQTQTSVCSFFRARFKDDKRGVRAVDLCENIVGIAPGANFLSIFTSGINFRLSSCDWSKQCGSKWSEHKEHLVGRSVLPIASIQ